MKMHTPPIFASAVLIVFSGLAYLSCSAGESFDVSPDNVPCEQDCDCYTGENYFLGTICHEGICQCPPYFPEMYKFPCCAKGRPPYDCQRQCRTLEECDPRDVDPKHLYPGTIWPPEDGNGGSGGAGSSSSSSASSASSSSSGGVLKPECVSAMDCAIQPDSRCGKSECVAGKCVLNIQVGALESQIRGDCHRMDCDVKGQVVSVDDPSDFYVDGRQCTADFCESGKPVNMALTDGVQCPVIGKGLCYLGNCVMCIDTISCAGSCPNGLGCNGNKCVPAHCQNNMIDVALGETDTDCGGPCVPCGVGHFCKAASDCIDGVCSFVCSLPTCSDGVRNDGETDVDCGGKPNCPACGAGKSCLLPSDCASGVCWSGKCEAPTCKDGIENGDETGVDCGGGCGGCGG